jgi:hypothetical protein
MQRQEIGIPRDEASGLATHGNVQELVVYRITACACFLRNIHDDGVAYQLDEKLLPLFASEITSKFLPSSTFPNSARLARDNRISPRLSATCCACPGGDCSNSTAQIITLVSNT